MSSGRKRVVSSCIPCYTRKQKVQNRNSVASCRQISFSFKLHTNNLEYSVIANILVITVPGDNALKRVSIILLRQAERLVLQIYQSLEERRHIEIIREV